MQKSFILNGHDLQFQTQYIENDEENEKEQPATNNDYDTLWKQVNIMEEPINKIQ